MTDNGFLDNDDDSYEEDEISAIMREERCTEQEAIARWMLAEKLKFKK